MIDSPVEKIKSTDCYFFINFDCTQCFWTKIGYIEGIETKNIVKEIMKCAKRCAGKGSNRKSKISCTSRQSRLAYAQKDAQERSNMSTKVNTRKIAMIGCGFVGSASAFALMQGGLFSEMVLIDADQNKAEGEALDISHGLPFAKPMEIYAGNYDDITDAAIIVVTAGANQKPGETRLDLVKKNVAIFGSIIPEIAKRDCAGILLIVANPVDILTSVAAKLSGFPENRVFGSGTVLDSARLKYLLGQHLDVDSRTVHAFIIGEHGDSEIAAWSSANVSGIPLDKFCEMRGHFDHAAANKRIAEDVKNSAYTIIEKKHATYYGVAMAVRRICEAIIRDEKSILPVSTIQHGNYGIDGVALSLPAIVGKDGIETLVPIQLNEEETTKLQESAAALKAVLADVL